MTHCLLQSGLYRAGLVIRRESAGRDGIRSNFAARARAEIGPESVAPALIISPQFERTPPILIKTAAVLK